ncbi:HNH endonuclease [Corynebacterium mustelae]|uniref:HNH endonuclease n=1 Tax=Corynebacterium mustelae TaxID=571915 RepID=A0A0G3H4C7_9CORY|nr:HNH endonuclease signature motif containing protein [Corynebacterium mustelae]AKK05987.1 HNH endonuclease [Corynebacterium mustelae]
MNSVQQILERRVREEATLLLHVALQNLSETDLIRWGKITPTHARRLIWITTILGIETLREAVTHYTSFDELDIIASGINKLRAPNVDKQKLAKELIAHATTTKPLELKKHVTATIATLNDGYSRPHKPRLAFNRTPDPNNLCYLQGAGPAELIAAIEAELVTTAQHIRKTNHGRNMKPSEAMFYALYDKVCGSSTTNSTLDPHLPYRDCYILPLDPSYRYYQDGKVATTTGALVDIKQLVNRELQPYGYAVAYCITERGDYQHVATYATQRFFNQHQRFIGTLEHPLCAHPDCDKPAKTCQGHHIQAVSQGGPTTQENYAPLCATHNGRNDDNPSNPLNGRIETDPTTGIPGYRRSPTSPLEFNRSPVALKGIRRWLAYLRAEVY